MAGTVLNDRQTEAVRRQEGPLLILAGAGSGKTATMTHRIAGLLDSGVAPWHILAVTFTNKAAREMRDRVDQLTGRAQDMWIMTFHAMCLRFLHMDPEPIGYDRNFCIYDTQDQRTLVKRIVKEKGISEREYKPQYLLSAISHCKEKGQDPDMFREAAVENARNRAVYLVYDAYEQELRQNGAMDFDDLLLNTWRLFRTAPEVLAKWQKKFQYIMVDEYQDTNHIQYELVKMLAAAHHNLCVVGDDDQCIYEWRGADLRNILDFEKDFPEAKVIKLEQNYRSTGNILAAAHSVIRNNKGRKAKKLWTAAADGEKVVYHRLDSDKEEAAYVARQIAFLNRKGRGLDQFAILYRNNAQSRLFESALSREGLPYQVLSGMRYYDRKEIKDAMAYMRLVVNPQDDLSLLRVINEPKRGIGARTVDKLTAFARVRGQSLLEGLADPDGAMLESLPGRAFEKVKEMVDILTLCRDQQENMTVSDIFSQLMDKTGYLDALERGGTMEDESRLDNLMDFRSVIADYEREAEEPSLADFMEGLALAADVDDLSDQAESVKLMTMHSAKGLEFPVVFLPGLEDGLFPGSRAFDSEDQMEEERRLCYVGMTRAKELLFLTSAEVRTMYGRTDYTRESQFLRELDPGVLEGDAVFRRRGAERTSLGVDTGSRDGFSGPVLSPFGRDRGAERAVLSPASPFGRPIDALKSARSAVHAEARRDIPAFAPGDVVTHKKFGEGTIIDLNGKVATVAFDSVGIKKLAIDVAPLKKIK